MKRLICLLVVACMMIVMMPAFHVTALDNDTDESQRQLNEGNLHIDDDPAGGYSGDYVVIYNPGTSSYNSASTGNMAGLILTDVGATNVQDFEPINPDVPYKIDVDQFLPNDGPYESDSSSEVEGEKTLSFEVGDTHNFSLYSSYCPLPSSNVQFECLAVGESCYIWTPTSTANNVYPLDEIDPSYAAMCAAEFDSKFDLMNASFGEHENGSQGDGRLNILYYNIDCGWTLGQGYVAGFFTSSDLYQNSMPCLNIDTYPGVYYQNAEGEPRYDLPGTYSTMVHEYQHLINYSVTGGNCDTWMNESMSAAAEEICYPGSSVYSRIQRWLNYSFTENEDWQNPPLEHAYTPEFSLHNGYSLYNWSNSLDMDDRLALYGQVSLYSQYLYSRFGNSIFRSILNNIASSGNVVASIQNATGESASDIARDFRIALTANDPNSFGGLYGFELQPGYDPSEYYDVTNLYSLLAPVVFVGTRCGISGGGAITIKPVGGVYTPPIDASSALRYYGITLDYSSVPVPLEGISFNVSNVQTVVGHETRANIVTQPVNANAYQLTWSVDDENIATVAPLINNNYVNVMGVAVGNTNLRVTAYDPLSDNEYSATVPVTVLPEPSLAESLGGIGIVYPFSFDGSFWINDYSEFVHGPSSVRSNTVGMTGSVATFHLNISMNAGDTISFEYLVSSEENYDEFKFIVNNQTVLTVSGESDYWRTYEYTATTSNTYNFVWSYSKDGSVNGGQDCIWIDNVVIPNYVPSIELLPGDANMDGVITIDDALMILRYATLGTPLSNPQLENCDMNYDGNCDMVDALIIMRTAMGMN